jgi:hypothetical protein
VTLKVFILPMNVFTLHTVSGAVQRLQVGYNVTRQRTANGATQSHGSGMAASGATAAEASSIKPLIPVAPPLNLSTVDRKLADDPKTGRIGAYYSQYTNAYCT